MKWWQLAVVSWFYSINLDPVALRHRFSPDMLITP